MFALTIAAHIETETLVREGRLHRYNDRKNQASRKKWKEKLKTPTLSILQIFWILSWNRKKEGRKGSSVDICKKLKVLIWSVTGMMP